MTGGCDGWVCVRWNSSRLRSMSSMRSPPLRASCTPVLRSRVEREEATMAGLSDILETTALEKVAGGFVFTEGPLWHPDGFFYFVDIRQNLLYRMVLGQKAEVVRKTIGGNGTTFDLQGRLVQCEGDDRMVTRLAADGSVTKLADQFEGKKL